MAANASLDLVTINFGIKIEKLYEKVKKHIDQVQKEAKAKGQKIDDKYITQIKKDFHKEDKKHKHRAEWFAQCSELNLSYSSLEADMQFDMNFSAKSNKTHDKDIDVPIPIMVGITVSLCGL
jgi:hypothetical protein